MSVRRGSNIIAGMPIIDGELNANSIRPVRNSAITAALEKANNRITELEKKIEHLYSLLEEKQDSVIEPDEEQE